MDYKRIYDDLMQTRVNMNRERGKGVYYERHHVVPDFMFQERERKGPLGDRKAIKDNIVLLTVREHLIAHVLLCKIYRGTPYEWKCGTSVFAFFRNFNHGLKVNRAEVYQDKYLKYKMLGLKSLSNERKNKTPVVDAETGEVIGSIENDHPNILSGKWVHHSKGKHTYKNSVTGETIYCATDEKPEGEEWVGQQGDVTGEKNPRFSGISNEEIYTEYKLVALKLGFIPGFKFFRGYYMLKYDCDFPKSLSVYRFNKGRDLYAKLQKETGYKFEPRKVMGLNPEDYL
jgi:hypothetical protein